MSRPVIAVALVALLTATALAGCLREEVDAAGLGAAVGSAVVDADGFAPRLVTGWFYETLDVAAELGFTVHAEVYLPDVSTALPDAEVPERFPTVLLASPYNGAGYGPDPRFDYPAYDFLFETLLPRGYAIVIGDSASNGGSGGCWDFMGPQDQAGAIALVEGIAQQPWSDGKVGMMGLSYDGMTQIMASSRVAEHLTTVVPAAPLTHAYAGLYHHGVHYGGGWLATTTAYTATALLPPFGNDERMPGHLDSMQRAPVCAAEATAHGNDPTGAYNAYFDERDFRPMAKDVQASVFFIQGFLDAAVKPDNLLPWFDEVDAPKKLWLGHWLHQYPIAQNAGRDDLFLTLHRWFDHWLKDIPNGIDEELRVDVQDSQGRWRHEETWPPQDAQPFVFGLGADGALTPGEADAGEMRVGGPIAAHELLGGAATFETAALDAPLHVAGLPVLDLRVASDRAGGQVVARLYEVSGSDARLVSQGAFNLLLAGGASAASPLTPGSFVDVSFELYPTDHVVPQGSKLRLVLDSTERGGWYLADPWGATLTLAAGGESAHLTLPTVERTDEDVFHVGCGRPIMRHVDCYDEDLEDRRVDA